MAGPTGRARCSYNGLGRYEDALAARRARPASTRTSSGSRTWALPELDRGGRSRAASPSAAAAALRRLSEIDAAPSGTDWALGIEARSRALLSEGEAAERLYREAIERLGRTRVRVELARAHLLYGEWLRRERRRVDAREQLRTAHEMFTAMGVEALRRARRARAAGHRRDRPQAHGRDAPTSSPPRRRRSPGSPATACRTRRSAPRLFISPRTVEYHLHKVFAKLGISSRTALGEAMADGRLTALSVRDRSRRSER